MYKNSKKALSPENPVAVPTPVVTALDRLMVVDDDQANIDSLNSMLGKLGFEFLPATDGHQALKCLAASSPDLILIKLQMPGMDGFELCKRIQENPNWADIPIVFFSANHDPELVTRALESGGVDYLAQPFNKPELLSRIRTHLMLKTTRDHLKQLVRDKEELLGMISHYLQNHLAGINMSAQLLLDHLRVNDDTKLRLSAENIRSASCGMVVFIKSLLANAAADRGFTINLESVHFSEAALRVLRQYEDAARNKELVLRTVVPDDSLFIHADSASLDQVLDNLISNAVKFSPPNREISVTLRRSSGCVECLIRDQGPGFTDEDMRRMFQRYARLSARPTGGEPSTGLGLSIANKLVHAMKGELVCRSIPGQGATFILRFPAIHK